MNTRPDHRSLVISAVFAGLLLGGVALGAAVNALRQDANPAVGVGDIIAFNSPAEQMPPSTSADGDDIVTARKTASQADCTLDPQIMARQGGSLVVESHGAADNAPYRVHWAGQRTAQGVKDCGQNADLLLSARDLTALAVVAGGFGVINKTLTLAYPPNGMMLAID